MTSIGAADAVDLQASLDPFATLPEWLAAAMRPERVEASLRRHVPDLADGRLLACRPQRLRAKGVEWLARYRVTVADLDGGRPHDVVLVGKLYPPSAVVPPVAAEPPEAAFGELGWACRLDDLHLDLSVETADPGLPALPALVEPDAAARLLQGVLRDAGYGEAIIADCRPDVVRYKPGSRCTVVVGLTYAGAPGDPPPPAAVVMKTHQGDKGRTAWKAMTALWRRPVASEGVVRLAEPLAYLAEERILVQGPLAEDRTLKALAREAIADGRAAALVDLREQLAKTGRALAALHGSGATYGRTATFGAELAEVREVVARLAASVPTLLDAADPLLARLAGLAREVPADDLVPAHHDFRPAQVLLSAGEIGFIDFDGAAMAEPALDLGRFRAKLRDIGISVLATTGSVPAGPVLAEHLALMDELCEHFTEAYREHAPVTPERVLLWEVCDLLTGMLHAWTKVRLLRLEPRLTVLRHRVNALGAQAMSA